MRTKDRIVAGNAGPARTRRMSKIFAAIAVTSCLVVGGSRVVRGSTAADARADRQDPFATPSLGPGAIPYDQMSAIQQADVDTLQVTLDGAQSADSVLAIERATRDTMARSRLEIKARSVGLSGTELDGVTP